jgi:hypothetical protein
VSVFLISPARLSGERARLLTRPEASFPLALELRTKQGARLGDVMSFLSGLYFRGKRTYAEAFGERALVITAGEGLMPLSTRVRAADLIRHGEVDIDADNEKFTAPLLDDAKKLRRRLRKAPVVLLGSIATPKYVDPLLSVFGERLLFPSDFVGRGDMSRGGLLLRAAKSGVELTYAPVAGATRHGPRPPRLG